MRRIVTFAIASSLVVVVALACTSSTSSTSDTCTRQPNGTWHCGPNAINDYPQCPNGALGGSCAYDGGACFYCENGGFVCICRDADDAGPQWRCAGTMTPCSP